MLTQLPSLPCRGGQLAAGAAAAAAGGKKTGIDWLGVLGENAASVYGIWPVAVLFLLQ